jgi:hypothetical protein
MKATQRITPKQILFAFVLLNLVTGIFIAADYGESTDEAFERERAMIALDMYSSDLEDPDAAYENLGNKKFYGTGISALIQLAEIKLGKKLNTPHLAITHYGYFVTFQLAVIALFFLIYQLTGKTTKGEWAALLAVMLFGTQPLLFGHAFINAKDIPLLSIFLVTITVGFSTSDHIVKDFPAEKYSLSQVKNAFSQAWSGLTSPPAKIVKIGLWLLVILLLLAVVIPPITASIIDYAYTSGEASLLGRLFATISEQAGSIPVDAYIAKAQVLAQRLIMAGMGLVVFVELLVLVVRTTTNLNERWFEMTWKQIKALPLKSYGFLILAGGLWGFALSTRVISFAAGGIVGLYMLVKLKGKAIFPGLCYLLAASIVYYLAWPYLWVAGSEGFIEPLTKFSAYTWQGDILFEGQIYTEASLPEYYIFKLIPMQFTLPLLVLALGGMAVSLQRFAQGKINRAKVMLLYAWLILPLAYTLIRDSVNYNNFRQYLFVMVPLFVFSALAMEWIFEKLPWQAARVGLAIIILLPGLIGLVQLHPYQYIYYNELTGGVDGAFRTYELDYWLTSYKEAAEFIDENLPPGSSILVWGGERRVRPYLTHPFVIINPTHLEQDEWKNIDYVLVTTEYQLDLQYHLDAETLFAAEANGVPLALVKQN